MVCGWLLAVPAASHWGAEPRVTHAGASAACKTPIAYPSSLVFLLESLHAGHRWGNGPRGGQGLRQGQGRALPHRGRTRRVRGLCAWKDPSYRCVQGWARGVGGGGASPLVLLGQFLLGDNEEVGGDGSGFSHPTSQIRPLNFKNSHPLSNSLCLSLAQKRVTATTLPVAPAIPASRGTPLALAQVIKYLCH